MPNYKYVEPYWKVDDAGLSHVIKEDGEAYEADITIPKDVLIEAFTKFMPNVSLANGDASAQEEQEQAQPVVNVPVEKDITYFQISTACTEDNLNNLSKKLVDKYGMEVWGYILKQIVNDIVAFCNMSYDNENTISGKFIHAINTKDSNVKKNFCRFLSYNSGVKFPKDDYFFLTVSELLYFIQNV